MGFEFQTIKLEQGLKYSFMGEDNALLQKYSNVWTLTLNRPESLNALNTQVLNEMAEALRHISEVDFETARALIITGAGEKAFVAGADIKEMLEMNSEQAQNFASKGQSVFHELNLLKIPVIAAVNGFALGGGLELALGCDFMIASDKARFGLPEVSLGLIPGFGGTVRLSQAVGLRKARELIFTGEMIKADEAYRLGLVSQVVPHEELMSAVYKKIDLILAKSPLAIGQAKASVLQSYDVPVESGLNIEAELFGHLFGSEDMIEGTKAFVEKRTPHFQGK